MSIREQESELFARWSSGRPGFVSDGVVDEAAYTGSTPKVLLLLKEVNDPGGGGWDLRQFLREGGRPQTWNNVTRWLRGINNLSEDIPWSDLREVTEDQRREVLRSIAAVNLKKSPGGHTTELSGFWRAVEHDAAFLREQFFIYRADLVICCGSAVAKAFDVFLKGGEMDSWRSTRHGVEFLEYDPQRFVIAFSHPEARVTDSVLYYAIIDAVRELRQAEK